MRIWQATWNPRTPTEFLIWAETKNQNHASDKHAFACSKESLLADLDSLGYEPDAVKSIQLYLPSSAKRPLTSKRLLQNDESDQIIDESPELKVWEVDALSLEPLTALSLLTSIPSELPDGLRLDDSFMFWIEATKLSLELLTRGRYLPGIIREQSHFRSHWFNVPTESEDYARFSTLVNSIPPICRALAGEGYQEVLEPNIFLESFVSTAMDSLIRHFLRNTSLTTEVELLKKTPRIQCYASWLASLSTLTDKVDANNYELANLEQALKKWGSEFFTSAKARDIIIAFRLHPPTGDSEQMTTAWAVEILFQAKEDSLELVSADSFWKGNLGFLKHTDYGIEELEELLLKRLAEAHMIWPELEQALEDAYPTHLILSTEDAYSFLRDTAKSLEERGFKVLLPNWWKNKKANAKLKLNVFSEDQQNTRKADQGLLGLNQLLDFSWEVTLGSKTLSVEEFRELVAKQTPLIKLEEEWVELNPEKIEATIAFLEAQEKKQKMSLLEALRFGIGTPNDASLLPVSEFSASGWVKNLLEAQSFEIDQIAQPTLFRGTLRKYQSEGLNWLWFFDRANLGCCLADDMGLGKTVQFLSLMQHERSVLEKEELLPSLLIVPMSILDNWQREALRFAPELRVYLHHGPTRLLGNSFIEVIKEQDLIVTTYSLAYRDQDLFENIDWARVTLDEAQNIKNLSSKQTQAVRAISHAQLAREHFRKRPCHRIALTGTPLENHLEELWSIFDFLNPNLLGSLAEFRSRFAIPIERYKNIDAQEMLGKLIKPFILRRLKTDPDVIQDLPEKIEVEEITSLTEEQAALYQQVLEQMLPQVDAAAGIHRKGFILSTITKLKQICNHPSLFAKDGSALKDRSGKLQRLEELVEVILAEGDKTLIFTQYAQMGALLQKHLQETFSTEVIYLHGALRKKQRDQLIERFQDKAGPSVFVLSLKAGGFGLNLTQANHVIHFDQWWNPAVEDQATDRAYRIGQTRNVQVRKLICKGTLEEKILEMLKSKKQLANEIVGSNKNMITELSTENLRELLTLST